MSLAIADESIPAAVPIKLSKQEIERLAEGLSRESGYLEHKDLNQVVQQFGGEIEITDFWKDDVTGSLIVDGPRDFVIKVPKHTTRERDRFTIAHELGHYVLHYLVAGKDDLAEKMVADRYGSGLVEWQANWFAASFLMPAKEFQHLFTGEHDQFEVANYFGVSIPAVRTRAKALGLLNQ